MTPDDHSASHRYPQHRITVRRAVYKLLSGGNRPGDTPWARVVDWFLIALIVLNVIAVTIESVEHLSLAHGPIFHAFDDLSVGVFSVEYLLRLWTAVELPEARYRHPVWGRLRWIVSPMALIDLVAILPFYLGFLVEVDLRATRMLRVLRIFKLSRYSTALNVMVAVARQEARAIGATLFVMLVVLVVSSSLMYLFEHQAQPHIFSDIPTSMWWAVVTLTTLGYGDMVPITPLGRMLGGMTAVVGVGMIALPAGVLASGFSEQMRIRREEYRDEVEKALDDGRLTRSERRSLDAARFRLGLSEEEAIMVLEEAAKTMRRCPNCGTALPHAEPSRHHG
ncbi:MAG: ion transporter [Magnetospirillum sp.]|nr:ion transporter [Magnetospirillum sp.]